MPAEVLDGQQILAEGLSDWRLLLQALHSQFRTGDFVTGLRLATLVTEAAEEMNHHPDLDLRYPVLRVRLHSHDANGVTERDVRLARRISAIAAAQGVPADPGSAVALELGLDTADAPGIRPFWQALLGVPADEGRDDEVVDPSGRLPGLWFQGTDAHETPRQRFHLDVHVPHDLAEQRVAAAVDAGGTLVSDDQAPSFWVLADPEGNRACVCTWQPARTGDEEGTG